MFLPVTDHNPLRVIRFQYVTGTLIALNAALFVATGAIMVPGAFQAVTLSYGAVPAVVAGRAALDPSLAVLPDGASLLTYMFLHGGWLHLLTNMAFLWVFGDNVEDRLGHVRFLAFYLACGVAAAIAQVAMTPDSTAPLIGASGAVSGVMAAYLLYYPGARVWVLVFMRLPLRVPASWALGGWIVFQFASVLLAPGDETVGVAWWAHIGGFFVGLALAFVFAPRTPPAAQ